MAIFRTETQRTPNYTRYSYNNNIKDLTSMTVMVDLPGSNIT